MTAVFRPPFILVAAVATTLAGCGSGDGTEVKLPERISCRVSVQPPVGRRVERTVAVTRARGVDFRVAGQKFRAALFSEGAAAAESLSFVIALEDGGHDLASGLYQFGPDTQNQFAGGHGFTGLVRWVDPESGAEVQYFCRVVE